MILSRRIEHEDMETVSAFTHTYRPVCFVHNKTVFWSWTQSDVFQVFHRTCIEFYYEIDHIIHRLFVLQWSLDIYISCADCYCSNWSVITCLFRYLTSTQQYQRQDFHLYCHIPSLDPPWQPYLQCPNEFLDPLTKTVPTDASRDTTYPEYHITSLALANCTLDFFVKNITFVMPHCQQTYGVLFWKQHRCRVTFANSLWRFLLDTANSIALTIAIWYPLLSASVEPIMSFPHSDCHWVHRWNADYKNGAHRIIKSLIAHMELLFLKYYLPTAWL